jgi:uncharacterized protein
MAQTTFISLPIQNLEKSKEFFTKIGFELQPNFTDENAACFKMNDCSYIMLLKPEFFMSFTKKKLADSIQTTEVIVAVTTNSRAEVDEIVDKAFKAGAVKSNDPFEMPGMYGRSFQDLDFHLWEVVYMDEVEFEKNRHNIAK